MVRNSGANRNKRKKIIKLAKGYRGCNRYRIAKQFVIKAMQNQYRDRKVRKRQFRSLWIVRINAALRALACEQGRHDIKYSTFISALKSSSEKQNITVLNRKTLANLAYYYPEQFKQMALQIYAEA